MKRNLKHRWLLLGLTVLTVIAATFLITRLLQVPPRQRNFGQMQTLRHEVATFAQQHSRPPTGIRELRESGVNPMKLQDAWGRDFQLRADPGGRMLLVSEPDVSSRRHLRMSAVWKLENHDGKWTDADESVWEAKPD